MIIIDTFWEWFFAIHLYIMLAAGLFSALVLIGIKDSITKQEEKTYYGILVYFLVMSIIGCIYFSIQLK